MAFLALMQTADEDPGSHSHESTPLPLEEEMLLLVQQAIQKCPDTERSHYLQVHAHSLAGLLYQEAAGRYAALESNIIMPGVVEAHQRSYARTVGADAPLEAWHDFHEWHRELLREPLEILRQNGDVSEEEKLCLFLERPWRFFPVNYIRHVADWEGPRELDEKVLDFIGRYKARGGEIEVTERATARRELFAGMQEDRLLGLVRSRDVAYVGERRVALRKRSLFALDLTQMPREFIDSLRVFYALANVRRITKSDDEGVAPESIDESFFRNVDLQGAEQRAAVFADAYQQVRTQILDVIEGQITARSLALIPLATGYSFKKRGNIGIIAAE